MTPEIRRSVLKSRGFLDVLIARVEDCAPVDADRFAQEMMTLNHAQVRMFNDLFKCVVEKI